MSKAKRPAPVKTSHQSVHAVAPGRSAPDRANRLALPALAIIVIFTAVVYWQARTHEFVSFDDPEYISENPHVLDGLTGESVRWAFRSGHAHNWHPLTWLSLMLDCQLSDLPARACHTTNLLFHLANTLLLYLVLRRLTGALWRSVVVAGLFALHPLHVESVAWAVERKDVLSTFFWLLTIYAYARYTSRRTIINYILMTALFILGLLAKPMLVTLPFALLLLDYWPLRRFGKKTHTVTDAAARARAHANHAPTNIAPRARFINLTLEKLPLLLIALASSVTTFLVQQSGHVTVKSLEIVDIPTRLANALVSYVLYIRKMVWPADLAIFYPHPWSIPIWQTLTAAALLIILTFLVIRARRHHRYLLVGWLWYLGTLLPVIGLVQVGLQQIADRYTYIPLIGLFIIVAWGTPDLLKRFPYRKPALAAASIIILVVLSLCTWRQVRHWRNDFTLYSHALAVTDNNYWAHNNLGTTLEDQGQTNQAIDQYRQAIEAKSDSVESYINLGSALKSQGHVDQAIRCYNQALKLRPWSRAAHNELGNAFYAQGQFERAIAELRQALQIDPSYVGSLNNLGLALCAAGQPAQALTYFQQALQLEPKRAETHNNLGSAYQLQGQLPKAISHFQQALKLKPDYAKAHANLATLLHQQGRTGDAIAGYRRSLQADPDSAQTHLNLGDLFKSNGDLAQAVTSYRQALQINPNNPTAHNKLALALQYQGQLDQAVSHYRQALQLKPDGFAAHNNLALVLRSQGHIDQAIDHFRHALKLKPDSPETHFNLAVSLKSQGRLDQAIEHLRLSLQAAPNDPDTHQMLGVALAATGALDQAVSHYRKALQLKPDHAAAHYDLAATLQAQGKPDQAIDHYRHALKTNPNNPEAHYNLGTALQNQDYNSQALKHYRAAAKLLPDWPAPLNACAWILATDPDANQNDTTEAIALAQRAAELTNHKIASVLDTLAAAYAAASQFDLARQTAQQALALTTNDRLRTEISARLELYQQDIPFRSSVPAQSSVVP